MVQYLGGSSQKLLLPSTDKTVAEFRNVFQGNDGLKMHDWVSLYSTGLCMIISSTVLHQVSRSHLSTCPLSWAVPSGLSTHSVINQI